MIENTTVSGNSAGSGGGIENSAGTMTITNSTVSGNSAIFSAGGIANSGGIASISFTTVSENSANLGGGLFNSGGSTINIKNSIVAKSSSGGDCFTQSPTINAFGTNFSTDGTCPGFTPVTPEQLSLGPLQDNGGLTQTHALLSGSVAIDSALDCTDVAGASIGVDQRGVSRPIDGNGDGVSYCDAGAYEAVASFDFCIVDDSNGSIFKFNSSNGNYQVINCLGFNLSGTASLIRKGGLISLQDYNTDRRVIAKIDTNASKGIASIQVFSLGATFTITDRNTSNSTCSCSATRSAVTSR
jgi:hypothetical protein